MIPIYIVQQQGTENHLEDHDSLNIKWFDFLAKANILPIIVPNNLILLEELLKFDIAQGVILTGGGTFTLGADSRSQVEVRLLDWAKKNKFPVIGVCRGMQALILKAGGMLRSVDDHVRENHDLTFMGNDLKVNSYHNLGCYEVPDTYKVMAKSDDGVVEAIHHRLLPWLGIMWHPERVANFSVYDISLFSEHFNRSVICED